MSPKINAFLFCIMLITGLQTSAYAQDQSPLTLRLSRNFGYSSGAGDIQGTFTLKVAGPESLTRVVFYIDGQVMGEVVEPPFELRFHTGDYPFGVHTLSAVGTTNSGAQLYSNEQKRQFVPAEEGWKFVGKVILPLLGIIGLSMLISIVIPYIAGRGRVKQVPLGAPRSYGILGGAVCPKCQRPFGIHIWGLNLAVGRYDRCPHCGKWSLVRRAPLGVLKAAEAAELDQTREGINQVDGSEERRLKDLEDSRYQDID